jgi:hypothetical protein
MFSKKATDIDEIFTVDLTLCSRCQIDSEGFVEFCGLENTNFTNQKSVLLHWFSYCICRLLYESKFMSKLEDLGLLLII